MTMKNRFILGVAIFMSGVLTGPAFAAKSWGVTGEVKAKFTGTVVDITCHLTGDCPENCGQGTRQLGLMTSDQGLIMVAKNLTLYSGAAEELYGFCGQGIEVDGLFTENRNVRFFQVQKMRLVGKRWKKATLFQKAWAEKNGVKTRSRKAKRWYRNDPRIKAMIEKDGYLGLGKAKDAEFFGN